MNQWENKKWYAYGTSMTSVRQGKYVPVVERLSGMQVTNYGICGGCITPDGYGKGNVKDAIMTLDDGKAEADLITIDILPNEGNVIGNIYDTDDASFCGCFNQCIRYLQENTKAQIVVIIMITQHVFPPEYVVKERGMTQFEFSETIERLCKLNSVPYINVFGESGLGWARTKGGDYQTDMIHLNELGGENMGRFVWSRLKDIPTWVREV